MQAETTTRETPRLSREEFNRRNENIILEAAREGVIKTKDGKPLTTKEIDALIHQVMIEMTEQFNQHVPSSQMQHLPMPHKDAITKQQALLTKMFYGIMHDEKLVDDKKIRDIYQKYLANSAIELVKSAEGKIVGARIKSMLPVINYLNDHLDVKVCNFTAFGSRVEDITTLAKFVTCMRQIRGIVLKRSIPEDAKEALENAVKVREPDAPLQVVYL